MTGDGDANLAAVLTIRKRYPLVQVVARSTDPLNGQKLTAAGAEFVIYPQEVVARSALFQIKKQHSSRISQRLFTLLAGGRGHWASLRIKTRIPMQFRQRWRLPRSQNMPIRNLLQRESFTKAASVTRKTGRLSTCWISKWSILPQNRSRNAPTSPLSTALDRCE